MDETRTSLPDRLRAAKGAQTWERVREQAGISERHLERLLSPADQGERGKRGPTLDLIGRLAVALDVRAGWLGFGDGEMR